MSDLSHGTPPVKGGQGRDVVEIEFSTWVTIVCLISFAVGALVMLLALRLWA